MSRDKRCACVQGRMPAKASQNCCEDVARRGWLNDTEGIPGPKLWGWCWGKDKSCLHNDHRRTWRRFLPVPKSGNWSSFAWVRKDKWLSMLGGFSVLGGIGEMLCVPNLLGQKEKSIFCHGPYCSRSKSEKGPLFYLLLQGKRRHH